MTTLSSYTFENLPRDFSFNNVDLPVSWHHVINVDSFQQNKFFDALRANGLFNPDSVADNLIPLPRTQEGAALIGSTRHSGGHSPYNSFIAEIATSFEEKYLSKLADTGVSAEDLDAWLHQSSNKINGLVGFLKTELAHPESVLLLHSSDPRNNLDSRPTWDGMRQQFNPATGEFSPTITQSSAYQTGYASGAATFDARPGSGTALDPQRGLFGQQLVGSLNTEFQLTNRPLNLGALSGLGGFGRALGLVLTGLGVFGLANDVNAAAADADLLIAEGDQIGADAQLLGAFARQLFTTARLVVAYSKGDGSFSSTLANDALLAAEFENAAERFFILRDVTRILNEGGVIPEKYQGLYLDGLASGEINLDEAGVAIQDGGVPLEFVERDTGQYLKLGDIELALVGDSDAGRGVPLLSAAVANTSGTGDWSFSNAQVDSSGVIVSRGLELADGSSLTLPNFVSNGDLLLESFQSLDTFGSFTIDTIDPVTNLISTINQTNIDGTPHLVRISALADTDAFLQTDFSFDNALNAYTPVANTFNFGDSSYDLGDLPPGVSIGVASEALPPVTGLYDQVFGVGQPTDGSAPYEVPTFNFYDSDDNVVRQLSYAQAAEATDDGRPAIAQSQAVDTNYSTNADDSWNFNTNRIVEGGFVADSSVGMVDGTLVTLTNPPPDDGIINDEGGDDTLPGGGGSDDLTPPEDSGPTLTTGRWRTSVSNGEEQGPPPPPTPPIITGAAIGRIFGSSLANLIDTDNVFEDIAVTAALQTGLGAVGATVDTLIGNGQIADISLVDASGNFQFNAGALAANDNCPMIEEAAA